jgi:putative addiction module component (TIGR02574 family)
MAELSREASRILEQALTLSVKEQEALAESLISNLAGRVNDKVMAAWDDEVRQRISDLDSGKAQTIPWEEVRQRNLAKLPRAQY